MMYRSQHCTITHGEIVPATVREAVEQADAVAGDELVFLKQAFNSALNSPYDQPRKVYEALFTLAAVAREVRLARQEGRSVGRLEDLFRQRGFNYRGQQSQTTRGKWGVEYRAQYEGRILSIERHLALGKGGPKTCLRIYFGIDDTESARWRVVVAHVGRHKSNTRS